MISDSDVASIRSIDVGFHGGTTSNAYSTEHEAEVVVNLRRNISSLQLDYTHLIDVYRHQVAGHTDHFMLRFMERFILKPILKEHLFQREKSFYEHVTRCCCCNDDNITNIERVNQHCDNYIGNEARNHLVTPSLLSYLPKYFQSVTTSFRLSSSPLSSSSSSSQLSSSSSSSTIKEEIDELSYLVLEDISHSYSRDHISIIDIKMGTQTYEPTASIEKIVKETSKFIHQRQLGFRISGMKVFNHRTKQYLIKDKFFGRSLEPSTVIYGLGLFFYNGYTLCKEIISDVIQQLNGLLVIMNEQVDYKFYCTSLLIIYNACPDKATTTTTSISTIMSSTSISNIISSPETMKLMGSSSSLSSSSYIRSINEEICDLIDARLLLMNSKLQLTASMRHFLLYGSCHSTSHAVTVKLVDFAHVIINDEGDRRKDEEFIHGLMNLIKSLKELLSKLDCSDDDDEKEEGEEEDTVRIILSLFQ